MYLKSLEINGFKSFARKVSLDFVTPITAIVGPNGSGKSNTAEAFRFVLGEQSLKNMRGKKGEDLIFTGTAGRMSRASVKVVLDNSAKQFPVDFKEITIERAVLRDGANEYILNGSKVRAKDISEMLSAAHIGASGHHIISQGEADKIISLNAKDRKGMLEEALGLRIYTLKKLEALRKLERVDENLAEVATEKKITAPRLRMLKKEVEKISRAEELRGELKNLYLNFFPKRFVSQTQLQDLKQEAADLKNQVDEMTVRLSQLRKNAQENQNIHRKEDERVAKQEQLALLQKALDEKSAAQLSLGKIEARIEIEEDTKARIERLASEPDTRSQKLEQVSAIIHDAWVSWTQAVSKKFTLPAEITSHWAKNQIPYQELSEEMKDEDRLYANKILDAMGQGAQAQPVQFNPGELAALVQRREKTLELINQLVAREERIREEIARLESIIASEDVSETNSRIDILELEKEHEKTQYSYNNVVRSVAEVENVLAKYSREEVFARNLYGVEVNEWLEIKQVTDGTDLNIDEKIQRTKILLESMDGVASREVVEEYEELVRRNQFIEREIADLEESASSLNTLIADLTNTIQEKFETGLAQVNKEFDRFFSTLFSGGKAKLVLQDITKPSEDGETDTEWGVEMQVSLPNKKISGLSVLSGGERSLTSIALLFAMSAVNPPPFIILDETDAALDEANSKRYGDMVELLSKNSQLILITHNRETMSRAQTLYGVTMDREGVSKLLSVAFDQAVAVAK